MKERRFLIAAALLAALAAFLVFVPALDNDYVLWDDDEYVYENHHFEKDAAGYFSWSLTAYYAGNWHPLTMLSHYAVYRAFGLDPLWHHLMNVLLHAAATFLLVLIVFKLMKAKEREGWDRESSARSLAVSLLCGLLFALHPIHVESVAWISERKDVLYAFFYLLSLLFYLFYIDGRKRALWYVVGLLVFALSLASKPMAVTLPVLLLLLDWYPLGRLKPRRAGAGRLIAEKIPYFLLTVPAIINTLGAQQVRGAVKSVSNVPPVARLSVTLDSLIQYIYKLILPLELVPFYPYPSHVRYLSGEYIFHGVAFILITALCIYALARKGRALWLMLWLSYLVMIFPVSGLFQTGAQKMADRYMYLPSVPFFFLAALLLYRLWRYLRRFGPRGALGSVLVVLLLFGGYAGKTVAQTGVWENTEALWTYVIEHEEGDVSVAHNNLALSLEGRGRYRQALEHYNRAIETSSAENPRYYFNRGSLHLALGNYRAAVRDLTRSLEISGEVRTYINRGLAYERLNELARALEDYRRALERKDRPDWRLLNNMGWLLFRMGEPAEAEEKLRAALETADRPAMVHLNLGTVLYATKRYEEAGKYLDRAVEELENPAEAIYQRALLYRAMGKDQKAFDDLGLAKRLGHPRADRLLEDMKEGGK